MRALAYASGALCIAIVRNASSSYRNMLPEVCAADAHGILKHGLKYWLQMARGNR